MSQELSFTSAPRGLYPGSQGFCTVAATRGLSPVLLEKLEALSAYRHPFAPLDPRNPVVYSHLRVTVSGKTYHVLSRIAPAGLDYSERGNKFAHHVVLEATELPAGGPAWLLAQPGFMPSAWDGEVRHLAVGRRPPQGDTTPGLCRAWQEVAGDAGWAGVLAEGFERSTCLVFNPGQDLLPLFAEALALLPPAKRWQVTFTTYLAGLPANVPCVWRGVLKGSAEARAASGQPHTRVIDLTAPLTRAVGGPLVARARQAEPTGTPWESPPEWRAPKAPVLSAAPAPPVLLEEILPTPAAVTPDPLNGPAPVLAARAAPPPTPTGVQRAKPGAASRFLWLGIGLAAGILIAALVSILLSSLGAVSMAVATDLETRRKALDDRENVLDEREKLCKSTEESNTRRTTDLKRAETALQEEKEQMSRREDRLKKDRQQLTSDQEAFQTKQSDFQASQARQTKSSTVSPELERLRALKEIMEKQPSSGRDLEPIVEGFVKSKEDRSKSRRMFEEKYDKWYANQIQKEHEALKLWEKLELDTLLKSFASKGAKEESKEEMADKIVEKCYELLTKFPKTTVAGRRAKLPDNRAAILAACNRVLARKEPGGETRRSQAEDLQTWLELKPKK